MQIPINKYVIDPTINFVTDFAQGVRDATPAGARTKVANAASKAVKFFNYFPMVAIPVNMVLGGAASGAKFLHDQVLGTGYGQIILSSTLFSAGVFAGMGYAADLGGGGLVECGLFGAITGVLASGFPVANQIGHDHGLDGQTRVVQH